MRPVVTNPEAFLMARRLSRELRYRPLPELIDDELVINAPGDAETHARRLLASEGIRVGRCLHGEAAGARMNMAKYDLVDVGFEASPNLLDHPDTRGGVATLRELGLIDRHETPRGFGVKETG